MSKHSKRRIPRIRFTAIRDIGWHVNYRDAVSGTPKKHRFNIIEREREAEARVLYHSWILEQLGANGDHALPTQAKPTAKRRGKQIPMLNGCILEIASGFLESERLRTRNAHEPRRRGTIIEPVYRDRARHVHDFLEFLNLQHGAGAIKKLRLADLTMEDIESYNRVLVKRGFSDSQVIKRLQLIKAIIDRAGRPCETSMPLVREFLHGDPARYPEQVAMIRHNPDTQDQWTYHYLHDVLGSVIGVVDEDGDLVERFTLDAGERLCRSPRAGRTRSIRRRVKGTTYDPYGKVFIEKWQTDGQGGGEWLASAEPNSGLPYSPIGNPFMWTGHRYDAAVGLYHTLFRFYEPVMGRWLQRDPIEYTSGSINLYEYVLSSPLYWIDPFGLEGWNDGLVGDADEAADDRIKAIQELQEHLRDISGIAKEALEITGEAIIVTATIMSPTIGEELAAVMMMANRLRRFIGRLEELAKCSERARKLLERAKERLEKLRKKEDELRRAREISKKPGTRPGDLPARGKPNSTDVVDKGSGKGTIRGYGPDG